MPITLAEVQSLLSSFLESGFPYLMSRLSSSATWTIANNAYPMNGHEGLFGTKTKSEMQEFMDKRYFPMYDGMPKLTIETVTVMDNRAVVELHILGPLKTGKTFDIRYAWFMDFDENTKEIVAVRDYLDTLLVYESITANEKLQRQAQLAQHQ